MDALRRDAEVARAPARPLSVARHRDIGLLALIMLGIRVVSMVVVSQPGYTDAYYYATVASRLAHGEGLTADFVWNYLEAPHFLALPVASHRFWMPLATAVQAAGIVPLGWALGDFRAGQLAIVFDAKNLLVRVGHARYRTPESRANLAGINVPAGAAGVE